MYDKDSGKKLLEDAGFRNVKVCAFRKGLVPDLKSLDIEQHKKTSFYLEAENR